MIFSCELLREFYWRLVELFKQNPVPVALCLGDKSEWAPACLPAAHRQQCQDRDPCSFNTEKGPINYVWAGFRKSRRE